MPYILQVAVGRRPHLNVFGDDYNTSDGTGSYFLMYITSYQLFGLPDVSLMYLSLSLKFRNKFKVQWKPDFLNLQFFEPHDNSDKMLFPSSQSNIVNFIISSQTTQFSNHSSFSLELKLYSTVWHLLIYKTLFVHLIY